MKTEIKSKSMKCLPNTLRRRIVQIRGFVREAFDLEIHGEISGEQLKSFMRAIIEELKCK
jgi:hypothetical protein